MRKESEIQEFKESTGELNEAVISIAAMLNKNKKGIVYFGLKNDGMPSEFTITDSTLRDVSRKIYEGIKPQIFPVIRTEIMDGTEVIKVEAEGEEIPYSAFGRYYIRVADEDRELSPAELRKMMISQEYEDHWEDKTSKETVDDVDEKTLQEFYRQAIESGRFPDVGYNRDALLEKLDLQRDGILTNAGRVLFSTKEPVSMKLVVFAMDTRTTILDINMVKGNIFQLIDAAMKFVVDNIRWRVEIDDTSIHRKEIPEIPIAALREVIINSFAHARYDGRIQHEIDIYSNRVSVINPGSFANDYKPTDFYKKELKSHLRNEHIAEVLYLRNDVETCGHGLKKVYSLCEREHISLNYENTDTDFMFEFSRVDRNAIDDIFDINDDEITEDERILLEALKENHKSKKADLLTKTEFSARTIDRLISSLKKKGYLERIGSNKTGYWRINK